MTHQMRDDELKRLLHDADAGIAPTKPGPNARCVRAVYQRRRKRRTLLTVVVPMLLVAAIIAGRGLVLIEESVEFAAHSTDAAFQTRLRALEDEAELHAARARALMAEREARLSLEADDPLAELRENVDIVAYRMILEADELEADMRPTTEAIELYERVMRDFPNTYSAEVAQERLTAADSPGAKS